MTPTHSSSVSTLLLSYVTSNWSFCFHPRSFLQAILQSAAIFANYSLFCSHLCKLFSFLQPSLQTRRAGHFLNMIKNIYENPRVTIITIVNIERLPLKIKKKKEKEMRQNVHYHLFYSTLY